jgi:hypothetical protein
VVHKHLHYIHHLLVDKRKNFAAVVVGYIEDNYLEVVEDKDFGMVVVEDYKVVVVDYKVVVVADYKVVVVDNHLVVLDMDFDYQDYLVEMNKD